MSELGIRLKRNWDGSASLTCTRPDGSITWQRQRGTRGLVFPTHDLTHYAVETVMGFANAFYGLIASGWEFGDFSTPWPRGPIPDEAREAELVVGLFETERRMGGGWSAEELRAQAKVYGATHQPGGRLLTVPLLSDEDVAKIHRLLDDVLGRWAATRAGESLELTYRVPMRA